MNEVTCRRIARALRNISVRGEREDVAMEIAEALTSIDLRFDQDLFLDLANADYGHEDDEAEGY